MIVPRNWGNIELQRYPEQIVEDAAPTATDGRFKAAAFCLFLCWLTTIFSLCHSIQHYCDRSQGLFTRAVDTLKSVPLCFQLILPLALVVPLYQAMCAWNFAWSPLNVSGLNVAIFAGGYAPSLLILLINSLSGFRRPNEDKELLRQRRVRGDAIDQELGLVRKPAWWRRLNSEGQPERIRDKIARNVRELGGGKPTARHLGEAVSARAAAADPTTADAAAAADAASGGGVELAILRRFESHHSGLVAPGDFASARQLASKYTGRPDRQLHDRTVQAAASLLFPGEDAAAQAERVRRHAALMSDEASPAPPPYSDATKAEVGAAASRGRERAAGHRPASGGRSSSAGTSNSITAPPQQVRSMLDV